MKSINAIQGREIHPGDIDLIRELLAEHPEWGRTRLSKELCLLWNWRNGIGRPKDMAARSLLVKLERAGHIQLPPRRSYPSYAQRSPCPSPIAPPGEPVAGPLRGLLPLLICDAAPGSADLRLFNGLLAGHHYLGHRNGVGEAMRYLVRDRHGRPLACLLFGAAVWKCAARDAWIGWDRAVRERNLQGLANNCRFLIPPWVLVPRLASHVLGLAARRIRADWRQKYGHPVHALETFVDPGRHQGTGYRAANWFLAGTTTGRTRNDSRHRIHAPVKDVYLYPLTANFRQELLA